MTLPAHSQDVTRRDILKRLTALSVCSLLTGGGIVRQALAAPSREACFLSLKNLHTNETFYGPYRVGDRYLKEYFPKINYVLRDFRTNEVHPIDPRTLDIIYVVHQLSGSKEPFQIISGFRSPRSNAYLRARGGGGVARQSLHMQGQAIDLRLSDVSTRRLRDIGKSLQAGGVGYYPRSDFVHFDSGKVRSW